MQPCAVTPILLRSRWQQVLEILCCGHQCAIVGAAVISECCAEVTGGCINSTDITAVWTISPEPILDACSFMLCFPTSPVYIYFNVSLFYSLSMFFPFYLSVHFAFFVCLLVFSFVCSNPVFPDISMSQSTCTYTSTSTNAIIDELIFFPWISSTPSTNSSSSSPSSPDFLFSPETLSSQCTSSTHVSTCLFLLLL